MQLSWACRLSSAITMYQGAILVSVLSDLPTFAEFLTLDSVSRPVTRPLERAFR
jgi:hypothetical protein